MKLVFAQLKRLDFMKKARTADLNIRIASRARVLERRETRRSQGAI